MRLLLFIPTLIMIAVIAAVVFGILGVMSNMQEVLMQEVLTW